MNRTARSLDTVMLGDCIGLMARLESGSVDFVLTDPPYITYYRDRNGRTVTNDDNDRWLTPAFAEIFRLLKDDSLCVSFYGWNQADKFIAAWRAVGFWLAGHLVFSKSYASSIRFARYQHEQAYLLAKGDPGRPSAPISHGSAINLTRERTGSCRQLSRKPPPTFFFTTRSTVGCNGNTRTSRSSDMPTMLSATVAARRRH
jgi:DNA modification methylase